MLKTHLKVFSVVFFYQLFTLMFYFFGLIDWGGGDDFLLLLFVATNISFILLGGVIGYFSPIHEFESKIKFRTPNYVVLILILFSIAYIEISAIHFTGKSTTNIFSNLDLKKNYIDSHYHSADGSNSYNGIIVLLTPFFWGALYIFPREFEKRNLINISFYLFMFAIYFAFFMLKGGDRELFLILLFLFSSFFVNNMANFKISFKYILVAVFFILVVYFNKSSRYSDYQCVESYCTKNVVSGDIEQLLFMLNSYLTQGYKGLQVALASNAIVSWSCPAISPMVQSWSSALIANCEQVNPYIEKINESGQWHTMGRWNSSYVWWANNFSFYFVPFINLFHSVLFSFSLKRVSKGDSSFLSYVFITLSLVYYIFLPMNNQVFLSLPTAFWFIISGGWMFYLYIVCITKSR
ncbi:hypothetical protein [Vibrio diabolicus]|uniref:hypothetical protein n=1 Tax=Vibrio diabolicus TaxID=50719 RepID=UPI0015F38190|nr:hypothetical protein [Vibrio diabolicus]